MRAAISMTAVLALAGCGRLGFAGGGDGGTADSDALGSAAPDAPATITPGTLTKLTVAAPLLDSPSPTSQDCGIFLVFRAADDTMMDADLMPFAALDATTSTLWFAYSCKDSDVAWSETLGSWQPPAGTFQRYDGDPASPGINEFVTATAVMSDGLASSGVRQLRFAFGSDGSVYGIGERTRETDGAAQIVPVRIDQPTDLTPLSYDLAHDGVFAPPAEPWAAQSGAGHDILLDAGTFYLYSAYWDGVSTTATGTPLTSIAVATTTDMISANFPAEPMVTGWTDPCVSAWGGAYHMIARDLSTNSYSYVHGTAPDNFDFAHAVPLGLAAHAGAAGAWDGVNYIEHGLSGDPRVSTARVVDGVMYIFYLAGVPPNAEAAAKGGDSKRGLGVFTYTLPT